MWAVLEGNQLFCPHWGKYFSSFKFAYRLFLSRVFALVNNTHDRPGAAARLSKMGQEVTTSGQKLYYVLNKATIRIKTKGAALIRALSPRSLVVTTIISGASLATAERQLCFAATVTPAHRCVNVLLLRSPPSPRVHRAPVGWWRVAWTPARAVRLNAEWLRDILPCGTDPNPPPRKADLAGLGWSAGPAGASPPRRMVSEGTGHDGLQGPGRRFSAHGVTRPHPGPP